MSEEKLYAVKNDEGEYWDFEYQNGFWELNVVTLATVAGEEGAKCVAHDHGGHVVTFIEEPEKVVLTKEQAKIVEYAHSGKSPASNIAFSGNNDEELLIEAYVNGYTVAKEKKYNVKVPHTNCGWYFKCEDDENENPPILDELGCDTAGDPKNWDDSSYFTAAEIEHYGLQDCECVEVTDDDAKK